MRAQPRPDARLSQGKRTVLVPPGLLDQKREMQSQRVKAALARMVERVRMDQLSAR